MSEAGSCLAEVPNFLCLCQRLVFVSSSSACKFLRLAGARADGGGERKIVHVYTISNNQASSTQALSILGAGLCCRRLSPVLRDVSRHPGPLSLPDGSNTSQLRCWRKQLQLFAKCPLGVKAALGCWGTAVSETISAYHAYRMSPIHSPLQAVYYCLEV